MVDGQLREWVVLWSVERNRYCGQLSEGLCCGQLSEGCVVVS